ncbi:ATP-binding cassette sub-family D member 3-like [Homarus americanus]|uniref:ATP-binding cassette sub-family D member 3-like n=1 Tax=Homarus americanus TaxID=6706 RepID=UPI001C47431E|nr:ATP-binding cassette sub-family D member 3-like [Homarus americanus]
MQDYYKSGRMLVKLAEAIGRLVLAGRELTRLAGFTARVQELLAVLKDLNTGKYQRTMLESKSSNGEYHNVIKWLSVCSLKDGKGSTYDAFFLNFNCY